MSDRLKMPPERDFGFYQRRKHDKWREVAPPSPALEAPVADSHAHIHMLPDPAWELVRCAANGVDFVCMIVDPSEDGTRPFDELESWITSAKASANTLSSVPTVRIATGVHPHNAKLYTEAIERELIGKLADPRVCAVGEIGLDYYYDLSPRDVQREVFRRQIAIAKQLHLPIALHLRDAPVPEDHDGSGVETDRGSAHREAFGILDEEGFPEAGTLLHCCSLPACDLQPWIDAGCYIAYGGAITFKNADAAREAARLVPEDRLLVETDSPYMAPEPMRGAACTPAHVIFAAERLAEVRGIAPGDERRSFLAQLHANTLAFYGLSDPSTVHPD